MAMPRSRSARSASFRDSDPQLAECKKIEGAGSWDALEWTKIDPVSRSVPQGLQQFLLEAEQVIVESEKFMAASSLLASVGLPSKAYSFLFAAPSQHSVPRPNLCVHLLCRGKFTLLLDELCNQHKYL